MEMHIQTLQRQVPATTDQINPPNNKPTVTLHHPTTIIKKPHKTDRNHQFWEEGSHPQEIQNIKMLHQKLDYIHQNPVKRGYIDNAEDWRYSSARNYAGKDGLIEVFTTW